MPNDNFQTSEEQDTAPYQEASAPPLISTSNFNDDVTVDGEDPLIIDDLAPRFLEEDYGVAKEKLKELYSGIKWTDSELAAQKIANLSDLLDKANHVKAEAKLPSGAYELTQSLLDTSLDDDLKVKKIEDWRDNSKFSMYNSKNPDDFLNGTAKEELIDHFATELRRSIYGKDRNLVVDSIARGVEAAVAPIVGTSDAIFNTDFKPKTNKFLQDYQNPANDETLLASVASGVGSVGGFFASSAHPVTALSYLGATLVDQSKSVYDAALTETGNPDAAKAALLSSAPGILLGTFADRLVGGSLGKLAKGQKGFLGALTGATTGVVGSVAQTVNTGYALAKETGNPTYEPTLRKILIEAAAGGIVGGAAGGIHDISRAVDKEIGIRKLETELKTSAKNLDIVPNKVKNPSETSFDAINKNVMDDFIQTPEEKNRPTRVTEGDAGLEVPRDAEAESTGAEDIIAEPEPIHTIPTPRDLTITPAPDGFRPNAFMRSIALALGGDMNVVPGIKGALAFYQTGIDKAGKVINRIVADSRIFRDPAQANATVAHEIGHFVDYADSRLDPDEGRPAAGTPEEKEFMAQEPVLHKLIRFNRELRKEFKAADIQEEGKRLSSAWRLGSEEVINSEYRNNPKEIQADIFSMLLNDPARVEVEFPKIWEAFHKGLEANPNLKTFWKDYIDTATDENKLNTWIQERRELGRLREAEIMQTAAEQGIENTSAERKLKTGRAIENFQTRIINRFKVAKDIFTLQGKDTPERRLAAELYNQIYAGIRIHNRMAIEIDAPFNRLKNDYLSLGIEALGEDPLATWKNYEFHNRVLNETTRGIDEIKENPTLYKQLGEELKTTLAALLKENGQPEALNPYKDTSFSDYNGQALVDQLAKIGNPKFKDYRQDLLKRISKKDVDLGLAAAAVLSDNTFNVRRYSANPDTDVRSSERAISLMKEKLGADKFTKLQNVSKRFHDIVGNQLFKSLEDSGKVSPELLDHLKRNKNTYITFNVLKYFEKDPVIPATIKKQYGTFNDIGDELSSTLMKTKALMYASEYQIANNAAISLAQLGGYNVELVSPQRKKIKGKFEWITSPESVFDLKDKLQTKDPDSSYLIKFSDGVPSLYKIDSPEFAKMFSSDSFAKSPTVSRVLDFLDAHSKFFLERELKTILSVPFVLSQAVYDRVNEAIYSRSKLPTIPLIGKHLSPELRSTEKIGEQEAQAFMKGELTDVTGLLVKEGVLQHGYAEDYGGYTDSSLKAENVVYETMGKKIPGEEDVRFSAKVNTKVNKALEEFGYGTFKPVKSLKRKAVKDEAKTKIIGYLLAKKKGLSDAEAVMVAREYFGTPDPSGGGTNATSINKLFLFGRAHINGLRALTNQFKDDPRGFGIQYGLRKGIPRLLLSAPLMAPLLGAMFGKETEDLTRKYLDKIPSFDKIGKSVIPLGFSDGNGKFVGWSVKPEDVDANYKAEYIRLPASREFVSLANLQEPAVKALEELIDTGQINVKHTLNHLMEGVGAAFGSQFSPAVLGARRTEQLLTGQNPTDYYRNKGILPKDIQEAGTMSQKFYEYMLWSLNATAPGIFNLGHSSQQSSTENLNVWDEVAGIPVAGPLLTRFSGSSNYGDLEHSNADQQAKVERDADIRIHLGDVSKGVYNDYVKAQSNIARMGKGWRENVSPETAEKYTTLQNWHARVYRHGFNELRAAYENGDEEATKEASENLEEASKALADDLKRISGNP